MSRRSKVILFVAAAAGVIGLTIVLISHWMPGAGGRSSALADDGIEYVNQADLNDANQPPGTHRKHTAIFDDIWDHSLAKGAEYGAMREQIAKVRLGITDSVWANEGGLYRFSDRQEPQVFVVLPKDWPNKWTLKAEIKGPFLFDKGQFPDNKQFWVIFALKSMGKPLAELGPLGIVKGLEFRWDMAIYLQAERMSKLPERRPKRPA